MHLDSACLNCARHLKHPGIQQRPMAALAKQEIPHLVSATPRPGLYNSFFLRLRLSKARSGQERLWRSIFGISCNLRGTNTTLIFRGVNSPLDRQYAVSRFETGRRWAMARRRLNGV